jgi:hypothetical protein
MINAVKVVATDNYFIIIDLEDGRALKLDMNYIKNESGIVIEPLKKIDEFKKVFVKNGIVTWPTGYDIDPYFLESEGTLITKTA